MRVVAILREKVGASKMTLAVHLAVAAQLAGLETAIIDLDPQSSSADCDRRGAAPGGASLPVLSTRTFNVASRVVRIVGSST